LCLTLGVALATLNFPVSYSYSLSSTPDKRGRLSFSVNETIGIVTHGSDYLTFLLKETGEAFSFFTEGELCIQSSGTVTIDNDPLSTFALKHEDLNTKCSLGDMSGSMYSVMAHEGMTELCVGLNGSVPLYQNRSGELTYFVEFKAERGADFAIPHSCLPKEFYVPKPYFYTYTVHEGVDGPLLSKGAVSATNSSIIVEAPLKARYMWKGNSTVYTFESGNCSVQATAGEQITDDKVGYIMELLKSDNAHLEETDEPCKWNDRVGQMFYVTFGFDANQMCVTEGIPIWYAETYVHPIKYYVFEWIKEDPVDAQMPKECIGL